MSGFCVKAAALGESCSATTPCVRSVQHLLACKDSHCVTVGEAGQPCDAPELLNNNRCWPVGFRWCH